MRALSIISLVLLLACDPLNDDLDELFVAGQNLSSAGVLIGNWKVTSFVDEGENETPSFRDILIGFEDENQIIIYRADSVLVEGTWNLLERGRVLDLQIPAFGRGNDAFGEDLYELHDDWRVYQDEVDVIRLVGDDEAFELTRIR